MLRVRRPSREDIDRLLAEATAAGPTYPEVGATRDGPLPAGYRHDAAERRLGRGVDVLERAVAALRAWHAQIGSGAQVFPEGARVGEEDTVVLLIRVAGLWASFPCRVVYLDEGADGFAFAYGTLPGHPEKGEVAFRVECEEGGDVVFRVVSFSRTVDPLARLGSPVTHPLARLGSPVARIIQKRVTRRYLDALADAAANRP